MTAITFPTDPANNELYTAPNGTVYIWDGEKWVVNSTIYTGPALENLSQDRVAPMFVNGVNTGITFAYNATTNVMTTSVADSDRLVNGAHTVSLGANGVLTLPNGSIINGSTIRGVAGTGELNYTGITIGPNSNDAEKTWMWVDHANAYISTDNSANTWTFNDAGALTFPQGTTIATADGTDAFIIGGAVDKDIQIYTYSGPTPTAHGWTFGADGDLTLPVGGDIKDSAGNSVLGGGEGLPTVTVPAETGTDYKGLQVSYGGFHTNTGQSSTRNVTKVVIHKPAATTTTITDDSDDDFFQVSGVGSSDILAMFVIIGDVNGEKPLSDITAFAEEVIDTVILFEGTEGEFRTVDQMKAAFDAAYADLVTAVGGVATNFEFFENNINVIDGGPTTVREGSGAIFEIQDLGDGTYNSSDVISGGINYLPGHKIKILGSALGGVDGVNDCIITVTSVDSEGISGRSVEGVAAGTEFLTYGPVTGTNYNVGSGFSVAVVYKYETYVGISSYGTNYVVGDVITLLGANITGGTTPANNITITVNSIGGLGEAYGSTSSGTAPVVWRNNNISDGGEDEYDSGNYINSSYLNEIAYNGGNTVVDGAAAFGTGSSYSFVYRDSIFGLFVTGNSSTTIGTSGSGPDSGSAIISGNIYGPNIAAQTFDNAVSHINIIGDPYAGPLITFTRTDYGDEIDEISEGLHITKDDQGWLYNALEDEEHGTNTPTGSLWNNDGWDDFSNVESRTYRPLESIWGGNFANIPGAKMIMLDTTTDKYWAIEFLSWTNNNQGGGASYTRQELDLDSLVNGIRFSDGTRLTSAEGIGRVKLRSPGERRIEEVYGYKQVSVTSRTTDDTVTTTVFSNNSNNTGYVGLSAVGAARDALIALASGNVYYRVQVSLNEDDWATGRATSWGNDNVTIYFDNGVRLAVAQGDTVYYRILTGGAPVTWWDKDDLPSGSSNFRGAVIKYHAYTGDATWIGTIHIVDDDGEEHITHTEVQSGGEDGENDDLWFVPNEGEIQYRRLDGDNHTLKIQWTATVFYGSEYYD